MHFKYIALVVALAIIIPVAVVAWWLISPLFIDKSVDEELPFAAAAVIPDDMTSREVEQIMAGMAKINQEVDEAMPESTTGTNGPHIRSGATATGTPAQLTAVTLKQGSFRDADRFHRGSGRATIYRGPDGSHLLRLEDFNVTNGPDLHVILTANPNPKTRDEVSTPGYVDLGPLKGNMGNQNYEIPGEVNLHRLSSVVIYCKPFHVIFSVASLENLG